MLLQTCSLTLTDQDSVMENRQTTPSAGYQWWRKYKTLEVQVVIPQWENKSINLETIFDDSFQFSVIY